MATQYLVKGEWASKNEYFVAQALDFYNIEYSFHVDAQGGSRRRGGFVIDFVVQAPFAKALEVFGKYWHTGAMSAGDRMKIIILQSLFGRPPIIIWENESDDLETAKETVRKKVM